MMAKAVVEDQGLRRKFAKRLIVMACIVVLVQGYEFRMKMNLYRRYLDRYFPYQGWRWVTTMRWGWGRAAGPYAHAILCGVIMTVMFRIQRWLQANKLWKMPSWKAWLLTLWILLGCIMPLSRGPWVGAIVGSVVNFFGNLRHRTRTAGIALCVAVLLGIPAYAAFKAYVAVGRRGAETATQETAAYRKELLDKYWRIAMQKRRWGWGKIGWPKVHGMPSVDNYWLLLFLMHGQYAVAFFVSVFVVMSLRLWMMGVKLPSRSELGTLCFALVSCYVMIMLSVSTVFLGFQTKDLLFIITGWGEGAIISGKWFLAQERPLNFKKTLT